MEDEEKQPVREVGEIRKRREKMADGRRYIIFYTFAAGEDGSGGGGGGEKSEERSEVKPNV